MSELEHESEIPNDAVAAAQLEKLRLEIDQLKTGGGWEQRAINFLPLLTVVIAVGGFLFGIYQYRKQQQAQHDQLLVQQQKDRATNEREQDIRIQNQIIADTQQVFRFVKDNQVTMSTVVFSLQDLDELCGLLANGDEKKGAAVRRRISSALHLTVLDECNFSNERDVEFNNNALKYWGDYLKYLQGNHHLPYLVGRYLNALGVLARSSPKFFEILHREQNESWSTSTPEEHRFDLAIDQSQFDLFEVLLLGIKLEIDGLEGEDKDEYIKRFQLTLCNPTLTEEIFGQKFPDDCSKPVKSVHARPQPRKKKAADRAMAQPTP